MRKTIAALTGAVTLAIMISGTGMAAARTGYGFI